MNYNKQQNITEAMTRPTAEEQNHHKMPKIKGITASVWDNLRYGNFYHQLLPFYEEIAIKRLRNCENNLKRWQNDHNPIINTYQSTRNFTLNPNLKSKFQFNPRNWAENQF